MTNRVPPPAPEDPLTLRPIDRTLLDAATLEARDHPRRRALLRYHEFADPVQRMLNAVEPESYIRPHCHLTPPKVEVFLALRGRARIVRFDAAGAVLEAPEIAAAGPRHGVEVPPGAWHAVVVVEPGTVFYEVKEGPYDPATDKTFAPWAPAEDDAPAARAYLAALRAQLGLPPFASHLPPPAALDDADDDLL